MSPFRCVGAAGSSGPVFMWESPCGCWRLPLARLDRLSGKLRRRRIGRWSAGRALPRLGPVLERRFWRAGSFRCWRIFFASPTDISWLEMADLNHPLLKRLSLEAPGTYHHCLAVANLAEAAAEAVGANPTLESRQRLFS